MVNLYNGGAYLINGKTLIEENDIDKLKALYAKHIAQHMAQYITKQADFYKKSDLYILKMKNMVK